MKTIITHPHFNELWESISKKMWIKKAKITFEKFPDTWPNFFIENVKQDVEHREVTYIWDFSTPQLIFENYVIMRGILDYHVKKLRVIMPYFPVGTMERINIKWEVATAKYFAEIFSNLPSGTAWKTSIHILDIHALSERFFFDSHRVNIDTHTAMNLIKQKVSPETVIVFPDDWAKKRFWNDFKDYETIVCAKTRIWDKREIIITEWNPKNKDLLIVDDLIQSGWTIIESTKVLKRMWAKNISAFATHWIFPNNSYVKLSKHLDILYVTNSIPKNLESAKKIKNMEVLDIWSIIEKVM